MLSTAIRDHLTQIRLLLYERSDLGPRCLSACPCSWRQHLHAANDLISGRQFQMHFSKQGRGTHSRFWLRSPCCLCCLDMVCLLAVKPMHFQIFAQQRRRSHWNGRQEFLLVLISMKYLIGSQDPRNLRTCMANRCCISYPSSCRYPFVLLPSSECAEAHDGSVISYWHLCHSAAQMLIPLQLDFSYIFMFLPSAVCFPKIFLLIKISRVSNILIPDQDRRFFLPGPGPT